jgi:hypothetical protein
MDDPITIACTGTRRWLVRRGLVLAVTAPALASVFHVGSAFADEDKGKDDKDKDDKKPAARAPGQHINSFRSDVSTVAQSAASGDFTSSNPGTDPLTDGRLRLRRKSHATDEGRLLVELRGAAANVSYDVFFSPLAPSKVRESLGKVGPTNKDGNLKDLTPSALSGTNRVGVFVIVRNDGSEAGKDEFVSSMGG